MGRSALVKLLFFLVCLIACSYVVSAQESFTDEELEAMSDDDLELICLVRGFELVKDLVDEETGEVYTLQHVDYVAAAKQCLSIESEMNEILEEHPELREELEEEIIKMQKEQEERRAELETLQQQLKDSPSDSSDSSSTGTAFVGKQSVDETTNEEETKNEASIPKVGEDAPFGNDAVSGEEVRNVKEEVVDVDDSESPVEEVVTNATTTTTKEGSESQTSEDDKAEEGLEISEEERVPLNEEEANAIEAASAEEEELPTELTLEYLRVEFIKYVKRDIERVTKILFPILKPMMSAGDLALRYIRAAISTLKGAYDNQGNQSNNNA